MFGEDYFIEIAASQYERTGEDKRNAAEVCEKI